MSKDNKEVINIISAEDARKMTLAYISPEENKQFNEIMGLIKSEALKGYYECECFTDCISDTNINRLISLGFKIRKFTLALQNLTIYIIRW